MPTSLQDGLDALPRPAALVLSGGTSLGALQVGMMQALVVRGFRPDLLVGSSVGAINGAYMAVEWSARRLDALGGIWRGLQRADVFGRPSLSRAAVAFLGRGALASPAFLGALIGRHLPPTGEELQSRFVAIATDALSGDPVALARGDLRMNLLASTAIPGIFPMVTIEGRDLVDGGVAAHVPIQPASDLGARSMVILDTGYPCAARRLPRGLVANLLYSFTLLLRHQANAAIAAVQDRCAVVCLPSPCPLEVLPHDFSQAARLIEEGRAAAAGFLADLRLRGPGVYGHPHFHRAGEVCA